MIKEILNTKRSSNKHLTALKIKEKETFDKKEK